MRPGRPGRLELPADVLAAAALPRGERVLAAYAADATWLLGTRARLVVVERDPAGESDLRAARLPWEQVEDAGWDRETSTLQVREAGEFGRPRREWSLTVGEEEPRELLELLRERVTASIVLQRQAPVHGKRGLVVACRRNPTGGPLHWTVAFDPGVEPDDPAARAAAEDLLARMRAELGELADDAGPIS